LKKPKSFFDIDEKIYPFNDDTPKRFGKNERGFLLFLFSDIRLDNIGLMKKRPGLDCKTPHKKYYLYETLRKIAKKTKTT